MDITKMNDKELHSIVLNFQPIYAKVKELMVRDYSATEILNTVINEFKIKATSIQMTLACETISNLFDAKYL